MNYQQQAESYIKKSQELLEECEMINDSLEGILLETPKPSEILDWRLGMARF